MKPTFRIAAFFAIAFLLVFSRISKQELYDNFFSRISALSDKNSQSAEDQVEVEEEETEIEEAISLIGIFSLFRLPDFPASDCSVIRISSVAGFLREFLEAAKSRAP